MLKTGAALLFVASILPAMVSPLLAVDDEPSRATLKGIKGVYIIVETFQPNFQDFAKKSGLTREQLEKHAHVRLNEAGIAVLSREEWLTTPGRPVLYINLNTHEGEKYWFAYDVRIELQQIAVMEADPAMKALVSTWSTNATGDINVSRLNRLEEEVARAVDLFVKAHQRAHGVPRP